MDNIEQMNHDQSRATPIGHTLVYRWIRAYEESIEEPKVREATEEIEFDERLSFAQYRHFIGSKKQTLANKGY